MKMNQKGQDCYQTPDFFFEYLNNIFNFTLDAAASDKNHKCDIYFKDCIYDGLNRPWGIFGTHKGHRVFCNPPFSQKKVWIEKAVYEVEYCGCPVCVMVLPANTMSTDAWHDYIEGKYHYEVLRQRISFINPVTGKPDKGNNSGTVLVYFWKKPSTKPCRVA